MKELLKNLINTPCVPQYQEEMIDFLKGEMEFGELETDHQGNIHLTTESSDGKIALMAHLNEIGFAVEHIEDTGFLRFQSTSEVDERFLLGKRMKIYGENGGVRGVVGAKPPHLLRGSDETKKVRIEDIFIDVGAGSKEEVKEMGIKVGDPVLFEGKFGDLGNGKVVGKSLDDRSGCAVVIEVLRELKEENEIGFSAWFLSQETSFPRGISSNFDFILSIDATLAGPYPTEKVRVEKHELPVEIGKGPVLTIREGESSLSQRVREVIEEAANKASIDIQIEASSRANCTRLNPMKRNASSAIISIPVKYLRTPIEVGNLKDLRDSVKLIKETLEIAQEKKI